VINSQGQLLNHIRYDSFGNITSQTNANVDFRFGYTGREFDEETGLYYYRARYYDAAIGRFISEDPMGFGAGDSNLYRYVGNSATNFTDPSGNFAIPWYVGFAASTALTGAAVLIAPDAVQAPMSACDIKPGDNSLTRAAIEIFGSLGIGIATSLAKTALTSLIDDFILSIKNLATGNDGILRSGADPLARKYGAAVDNYSDEFEAAYQELKASGVDIVFEPEQLAYSPSVIPGTPGRLKFDLDGSIGALRHEMRHFLDDQALKYPGLNTYIKDPNLMWKLEYRGYMEEIRFARNLRDFDSGREILQLMKNRRMELIGR
jgi:RHS repeat-associated protein